MIPLLRVKLNMPLWIGPAGISADTANCVFEACRDFSLTEVPASVEMSIACEGVYRCELNGAIVSRGPARGTRRISFCDTVEIARYLRPGLNSIKMLVRYSARANGLCYGIAPAIRLDIPNILATDARWHLFLCDKAWPAGAPWFSQQAGCCEWHDLRYDAAQTPVATHVFVCEPIVDKQLLRRETAAPVEIPYPVADIPSISVIPKADLDSREIARLNTSEPHAPADAALCAQLYQLTLGGRHAVSIPEQTGGIAIVFDFGREITGRVEIELDAPDGCVADLSYEEELWEDGRIRSDHTHTNPTYQFCDRLILKEGRNLVTTALADRGFRMVQLSLRNISAPIVIHSVYAIDRRNPLGERASFFCGNYRWNRLWDVSRETLSACITDMFTDCPWRERLFYINDMAVANRTLLTAFGDTRITRQALEIAFDEMGDDDLITSSCPGERCSIFAVILSADLTLAMVLHDYWLYSGDTQALKKFFPKMLRILARFRTWMNEDGIIIPPEDYWNFFDWSYEENGTMFSGKASSILNYLYIFACQLMNGMAPAAEYELPYPQDELKKLKENTLRAFWSEQFSNIIDGPDCQASPEQLIRLGVKGERYRAMPVSRIPQALALLAEAALDKREAVIQALLDESLLTPDLYYLFFILEAMDKTAQYSHIMPTIEHYWGKMMDTGTPTFWENGVHDPGKAGFGGSASLCHGFSTAPASFLQRIVLGITPLAPGFARFSFAPKDISAKFAQGRIPTPNGAICVAWRYQESQLNVKLTVPPGCQAITSAGVFPPGTHAFSMPV